MRHPAVTPTNTLSPYTSLVRTQPVRCFRFGEIDPLPVAAVLPMPERGHDRAGPRHAVGDIHFANAVATPVGCVSGQILDAADRFQRAAVAGVLCVRTIAAERRHRHHDDVVLQLAPNRTSTSLNP